MRRPRGDGPGYPNGDRVAKRARVARALETERIAVRQAVTAIQPEGDPVELPIVMTHPPPATGRR